MRTPPAGSGPLQNHPHLDMTDKAWPWYFIFLLFGLCLWVPVQRTAGRQASAPSLPAGVCQAGHHRHLWWSGRRRGATRGGRSAWSTHCCVQPATDTAAPRITEDDLITRVLITEVLIPKYMILCGPASKLGSTPFLMRMSWFQIIIHDLLSTSPIGLELVLLVLIAV